MRVVDLIERDLTEEDWDQCHLVLISGMITQYSGILETIRAGKRRGKIVVVGGAWVFHFPEEALRAGADVVVKGEGEYTVSLLVEAIRRGESGIIIEGAQRPDMNDSPPPRYDLLNMQHYVNMSIQFSRGCPFHCEFCDITHMFGRGVRTKSPPLILSELQALYDLGWRRSVFFVDDNFIGNPGSAKALLTELISWMEERGHPFDFLTQASVNLAADPELLDLMVRAGFSKVFLGIETQDVQSLHQAKKFHNAAVDLNEVCEKINRAGLQIIASFIIGFDHELPGADQRLIDFANRNHIPEMFITLLQAGPGTDLWSRLEREGRLLAGGYDDNLGSQTGLPNFLPTRPMRQIVGEFIRLYEVLYDPESYQERAFQHISRMKPAPIKKGFSLPLFSELRAVAITLFRQGVKPSYRGKFWKLFLTGIVRFPKNFHHFLSACIVGEHLYEYRKTIKDKLNTSLAQNEEIAPYANLEIGQ